MKGPEQLQLPNDFPVSNTVADLPATAKAQRQWWYDVRRVLQDAIEGLRGSKKKFDTSGGIGKVTPILGTTAPISGTTPYTWVEVVAPDGTVCVMPLWKKG